MYQLLILSLFTFSISSYGEDDECKYFKYCGSSSGTSSAKKSSPSVGSSGRSNPSIVSKIKGFGLETLYQNQNPIEFNLVTGNGKFGGMLSSSSGENSFFGNRTIELDDDFYLRMASGKRYKNKKLQLALGVGLISKKYFELNMGGSAIKNKDTNKINAGFAISGKLAFLNFGLYRYKDDIKLNLTNHLNARTATSYSTIWGSNTYEEAYNVSVYTVGTSFLNVSLDAAIINSQYKFYSAPTQITIISSSLAISNFLLNFAYRNEFSDNMQYMDGALVYQPQKIESYYGLQYLPNKHLMLGIGYNNYLMHEASFTLTLFL
jgi:hypothetical protein